MDYPSLVNIDALTTFVTFLAPSGLAFWLLKRSYGAVVRPRVDSTKEFFTGVNQAVNDVQTIKSGIKALKVLVATQQAYTHLLSNVATRDPLWFSDVHGKTTAINRQFTMRLGWTAEEMQGYGWKRIIHPEYQTDYYTLWDMCVREQRDFEFVCKILSRDGRIHDCTIRASQANVPYNGASVTIWLGYIEIHTPQETPTLSTL